MTQMYLICLFKDMLKSYKHLLVFLLVSQLQKTHLPWGVPQGGAGKGGCLLTQNDFITGYSTSLRVPLWVAYKLHGEVCYFRHNSSLILLDAFFQLRVVSYVAVLSAVTQRSSLYPGGALRDNTKSGCVGDCN